VLTTFVEEVIDQGRLERADGLVAVNFVELDPLPGQQQGREGLKQVSRAFRAFHDIPARGGESTSKKWAEHDETAWYHSR